MTTSELIVFLPLVGAILGAVVGGVVGAYANSRARDREVKKMQDQERRGLLLLVGSEVQHNTRLLTVISAGKPSAIIQNLQTIVWDETQIRLSSLLNFAYLEEITNYYALVKVHQTSPIARKAKTEDMTASERQGIESMMVLAMAIMRKAQDYIGDSDFAASVDQLEQLVYRRSKG
ncbi:MAG: hypothetical protein M3N33_00845 [Actinomycetota bacterium]|nr:hypothetical protein [Actinomycetota bacterium]